MADVRCEPGPGGWVTALSVSTGAGDEVEKKARALAVEDAFDDGREEEVDFGVAACQSVEAFDGAARVGVEREPLEEALAAGRVAVAGFDRAAISRDGELVGAVAEADEPQGSNDRKVQRKGGKIVVAGEQGDSGVTSFGVTPA